MTELKTRQNGYGRMEFTATLEANEMALTDEQIIDKAVGYNYGGQVYRGTDGTVSGYGYID